MTARLPLASATLQDPAGAQGGAVPSEVAHAIDFDDLYASEFAFVWRCLRGLGVDTAQLADAAQEVFVVVHRRLAEAQSKGALQPWLYGVVRHVALNQRRARRRKEARFTSLEAEPAASQPTPLDTALAREAAQFLAQFLDSLDPDKREVFLLAEIEQWTVPEIATATAIPVNTAYTRLRAARLAFERFVAAQAEAGRDFGATR